MAIVACEGTDAHIFEQPYFQKGSAMGITIDAKVLCAFVRRFLGINSHSVPVYFTDTGDKPVIIGQRGGHYTRAGEKIYHPSAYSVRGWSNMEYQPDSREIYVGQRWIERHLAKLVQASNMGVVE